MSSYQTAVEAVCVAKNAVLLLLSAAGPLGRVAGGDGFEAGLRASRAGVVALGWTSDGADGIGARVEDDLENMLASRRGKGGVTLT